jgi:hypothetical protein
VKLSKGDRERLASWPIRKGASAKNKRESIKRDSSKMVMGKARLLSADRFLEKYWSTLVSKSMHGTEVH